MSHFFKQIRNFLSSFKCFRCLEATVNVKHIFQFVKIGLNWKIFALISTNYFNIVFKVERFFSTQQRLFVPNKTNKKVTSKIEEEEEEVQNLINILWLAFIFHWPLELVWKFHRIIFDSSSLLLLFTWNLSQWKWEVATYNELTLSFFII